MENNFTTPEATGSLDLRAEILKYFPFWFWFLGFVTVSLLLANVYLRYTPNAYEAVAKIKILDNSNSSFRLPSDGVSIFGRSKLNVKNELENLKSYRILGAVVSELDLMNTYYSPGRFLKTELWKVSPVTVEWFGSEESINDYSTSFTLTVTSTGFQIEEFGNKPMSFNQRYASGNLFFMMHANSGFKKHVGQKYIVQKSSMRNAIGSLYGSISAGNAVEESEILKLNMQGLNSKKLEDVLNTLVRVFNQDGINDRQIASKNTIKFVNDRFSFLASELDSIENYKVNYKKTNKLISVESAEGITTGKKSRVEDELFNLESQITLSRFLEQLIRPNAAFSLLPSDIGINDANVNGLVMEYNTNVSEHTKLLISAGSKNPIVEVLHNKILSLQSNMLTSIRIYKEKLNVKLSNLKLYESQNDVLYSSMPEKEKVIRSIERQQKIKENLYLLLLQKREEAGINLAITAPSVKVVEFALSSPGPISPNRKTVYMLALVLGILVPFLILFIRFFLDNKIHVGKDITTIAGTIPILAEIPYITQEGKYIVANDRSVLAESYRNLRTNIDFMLPLQEHKQGYVVFSTSSIKGEGKTFNAVNMAIIFAQMNKKVLLIGSDMRNPQLHKYINLKKSQEGLSSYLFNAQVTASSITLKNTFDTPNLDIILSGVIPPNPSELLSNGRFEHLLNEAKPNYDYIIVDSAPTLLVTDTLLIANLADLVVYVTRADVTENQIVEYSRDLHLQGKIKNMAYIVNSIGWLNVYGYSYKYNYNYNYGYGYNYDYSYSESEDVEFKDQYNLKLGLSAKIKQFFTK